MDPVIDDELFYRIALTQVEGIGDKMARQLLHYFGSAREIFRASPRQLGAIDGLGIKKINGLKHEIDKGKIENEIKFIERNRIQPLFINDPGYPKKLSACPDAPVLLYYKGKADLNADRMVAVIGTRKHTDYGARVTEELVEGLQGHNITVVSGLAFGIDVIAHKKALQCRIPTIGVVAHGLDQIYPVQHRPVAKEMTGNGGLLTEYVSGTNPDKFNFPMRNRIVAGMTDLTVLVETEVQGGAMITAKLAASYNRDIAAFPGRTIDNKSSGCNYLIRTQMAQMITGWRDVLEMMNWDADTEVKVLQPRLFDHLSDEEAKLTGILEGAESAHIDELQLKTSLNASKLASLLLNLELNGMVKSLPGKRYRLI